MAGFLDLLMGGGAGALDPKGQFMADAFMNKRIPGDPVETYHTMLSMLSPDMVNDRRRQSDNMGTLVENAGLSPEESQDFTRQALGLMMSPNQMAEYQAAVAPTMFNAQKFGVEQDLKEREFSEEKRATGVAEGQKTRELGTEERKADADARAKQEQARANMFLADLRQDTMLMRQMIRTRQTPDGEPLDPRQVQVLQGMLGLNATDPGKMRLAGELLRSSEPEDRVAAAQILQDQLGMDMADVASAGKWFNEGAYFLKNGDLFKINEAADDLGSIGSMNFDPSDPEAMNQMFSEAMENKANMLLEQLNKDKPQEQ